MSTGTSTPDGIIRNREVDPAVLSGGPWDGRNYGYVPSPDRQLSPAVKLHEEFDTELDPISYQVVRNRFWNLNLDHSDTIKRVSGSPLIVYMDDFNTSLLTENGDSVVCGPSIQYFTGHGDHVVKWTLEHRGENPGIEDGDVFFQNDPYIGTAHQPDAAVYAPIFWQGRLFCWVFSCCHVGDLGGTVPGSFVPEAPDIFFESTPVPPVKLVRAGETQRDVAELIARKSRLPDLLALQLRSQIAGIKVTRNRVEELLEEHGPSFVKGVMRRIIRDCSAAVGERLSRIPDGSWQERIYIGSAGPEDREAHRLVTTVEKRGDRLIFANEGTDPQFSAANCTYGAWRSANVCAVSAMLAWDQRYCPAGVADHLEFVPTPDTLSVATYPGAVSPVTGAVVVVYLASQVLSKMLLAGPEELRRRANASGGTSLPGWWVAAGTDRNGRFVAEVTGDSLNGSLGAFPFRDGVDTGGAWYWPRSTSGNVEGWEQSAPIVYLYRREQIDSGGAGTWRGGNGCELAVIAHKSSDLSIAIISTDPAVNCSPGLAGGNPGHSGNHLLATGRSVRELLGSGAILACKEDLESRVGKVERLSPKAAFVLSEDEAFVAEYPAGGGYGSPFIRDPEAVAADVRELRLSRERALSLYGVAIGADGEVDAAATERARAEQRAESLRRARPPASRQGRVELEQVEVLATPWQGLAMIEREGDRLWACAACGELLGPAAADYKAAAAIYDRDPAEVDPEVYPAPSQFCDDTIVFRQTLCPGCGELFNTEVCKAEDPVAWDLRLGSAGGRAT